MALPTTTTTTAMTATTAAAAVTIGLTSPQTMAIARVAILPTRAKAFAYAAPAQQAATTAKTSKVAAIPSQPMATPVVGFMGLASTTPRVTEARSVNSNVFGP